MRSWVLSRTTPWRVSDSKHVYRFWPNREKGVILRGLRMDIANCEGPKLLAGRGDGTESHSEWKKYPWSLRATEIRISAGVCFHLPLLCRSRISRHLSFPCFLADLFSNPRIGSQTALWQVPGCRRQHPRGASSASLTRPLLSRRVWHRRRSGDCLQKRVNYIRCVWYKYKLVPSSYGPCV